MEQQIGFLESELERAVATHEPHATGENVISLAGALRGQENLRERERRFRNLLDALPAAVYTTDAAGRITYYNEAAAQMWGHRPPLGSSEWCGSWEAFLAHGPPVGHAECPVGAG